MKHFSRPSLFRTLSAGLGLCALSLPWLVSTGQAQVVFSQDFSSSTNRADYVGTGANQFDAIADGTGNSFGLVNGTLQSTKTAAGGAAISRLTALPTAGKAASFQFSLLVSGTTTSSATNDLIFQVGSNSTNATGADNTNVYQNFSIDLQAGGVFAINNTGQSFTGQQTLILDLNNSGATVNFPTPGGGSLALQNDNFTLFVGTTNVLAALGGQIAVGAGGSQGNAALDITQFKLRYQATADDYTVTVDNFLVTVVPEPSTYALLGVSLAGLGTVVARRRRAAC